MGCVRWRERHRGEGEGGGEGNGDGNGGDEGVEGGAMMLLVEDREEVTPRRRAGTPTQKSAVIRSHHDPVTALPAAAVLE